MCQSFATSFNINRYVKETRVTVPFSTRWGQNPTEIHFNSTYIKISVLIYISLRNDTTAIEATVTRSEGDTSFQWRSSGPAITMAARDWNYEFKKKSPVFIEIPFIGINNFKVCWAKKIKLFRLQWSFCRPLDSAALGGRTTRPALATPLRLCPSCATVGHI